MVAVNAATWLENSLWHYRGRVLRLVDGDTIDMQLDLGFGRLTFLPQDPSRPHPLTCRLRFDGINAPEKRNETLEAGKRSQAALGVWITTQEASWSKDRWPFIVRTGFDIHIGRWIGEVFSRSTGQSASDWMVEYGYAVRVVVT